MMAIVNPDRPSRITVIVANTIFGALSGDQRIDWGLVMWDQMVKMVNGIGKSKPSSISPFLFHLYLSLNLLREKEKEAYEVGAVMIEYEIEDPKADRDQDDEVSEEKG